MLDAALELPLIFQFYITKLKQDSLLHHIRVDTPPIVSTLYDLHEKELQNILKYVQPFGLANAYHPLDIDLLAEAAVKHYLWITEDNFKVEAFDLSNT